MISIVCVYDNDEVVKNVLLRSLKRQRAEYELILLDNTTNRYLSASQALNCGGAMAKGDYIMVAHQDMWLESDSWLEEAEKAMAAIPDLGIAGVAGQAEHGKTWPDRCRYSIECFGEIEERGPVDKPEEVQTLDECLLIVPRSVFGELQFDEREFDGWHCYGADYCLSVRQLGLKAYVIPGSCCHSTPRQFPGYRGRCAPTLSASSKKNMRGLPKYQRRLYLKHRRDCKLIHTWTGEISAYQLALSRMKAMMTPTYLRLFPDFSAMMKRELAGCDSLADLGCGHHSQLALGGVLTSIDMSVGVELFEPSVRESSRKRLHKHYVRGDVARIEFKPKSVDVVIALELLEHLTKDEGARMLVKMEQWARKMVIVSTPNGYVWQDAYNNNPFQEHKSGWTARELRDLEFEVLGLNGWKRLRGYKSALRYRPAFFWRRVSDLTQKITCHYPEQAFQLLAIKKVDQGD